MRLGRPLNLSDAPNHPAFSYRPETGEDPFHAFMGVPLLRGGRSIGVLVVQNRTERVYSEDEVEDLQIIAMVLAEMVAGGELAAEAPLQNIDLVPKKPERLKGARFAEGLALGVAVLHEPPVAPSDLLAEDVAAEEERLREAITALQAQIDNMLEGQHGLVEASYEVLETYRMFAYDRGWRRSLEDAVRNGLTAEAAVERVRSEHRARLGQAQNINHQKERQGRPRPEGRPDRRGVAWAVSDPRRQRQGRPPGAVPAAQGNLRRPGAARRGRKGRRESGKAGLHGVV